MKLLRMFSPYKYEMIADVESLQIGQFGDLFREHTQFIIAEVQFANFGQLWYVIDVLYAISVQLQPLKIWKVFSDLLQRGQFVFCQFKVFYVVGAL